MARRVGAGAAVLLCGLGLASAAERFAVLEFFGRPTGAYCSAAGPAMTALQRQLVGEAVLLEYDYDRFRDGRQLRFWATGVSAQYLPLVMVGSGYRTSSGLVDYARVYAEMVDSELARPPRAEVTAYWRRSGDLLRSYVAVRNTGDDALLLDEQAAVWVIVYENAPVGVSNTWVRSATRWRLDSDLAPGEIATAVIDAPGSTVEDWGRVAELALVEDQPGGDGRYDMLQAAEAAPASLTVAPTQLRLTRMASTAKLALEGPHVLEWSATTDVRWLEVTSSHGFLPGTVTVVLRPELRPPSATKGNVFIDAVGDSMAFSALVEVSAGIGVRRPSGRCRPID